MLEQKQLALKAVNMLLRYPHAYDQMVRTGYVALLVRESCDPAKPEDGTVQDDLLSVVSSVSSRIAVRTQHLRTWQTRRLAALGLFRTMRLRSGLLSARDAPELLEQLSETLTKLNIVREISLTSQMEGVVKEAAAAEVAVGMEDRQVILSALNGVINLVRSDLAKFSEALAIQLSLGLDNVSEPEMVSNILRTLTRMVAFEDSPTRFVESQHKTSDLMRHPAAKVFRMQVPMATALKVTFDPLTIGRGAVRLFVGGELEGEYNRKIQLKANGSTTDVNLTGDTFEWQFIFDTEKLKDAAEGRPSVNKENSESPVATENEGIEFENEGYRFFVLPMYETSTLEEVKQKRYLVLNHPNLVHQIALLHHRTGGGIPGLDKEKQDEIDLEIVTLMSYLSHLGEDEPHEAMTSESNIFVMMYRVLQRRPSPLRDMSDPSKMELMTTEHVAASRFFYGLSLSEQGRSNFGQNIEAVEKIVDLAAEESTASRQSKEFVSLPHTPLCYDKGYVINTLTNFACTPEIWTLPVALYLLRPGGETLFRECEFARGKTNWSMTFHVFLNEDFNKPGTVAWLVYKGFTANDIQLAVGLCCAETRNNKSGQHPIVLRWTHNNEVQERIVHGACVECFRWMHICVGIDQFIISVSINGELTTTEHMPGEVHLFCASGTPDLCIGCPGWEGERASMPNAWIYAVNVFGGKALEPSEALFHKRREELMAWRSTAEDFDEQEFGRSGVDMCPDPLKMPSTE
ncbi:unnamed protein product, partial [Polarella glacialis]